MAHWQISQPTQPKAAQAFHHTPPAATIDGKLPRSSASGNLITKNALNGAETENFVG
jgi:hypothetical protein